MINAFNARLNFIHHDIKPRFEIIRADRDTPLPDAYAIYFDESDEHKTLVFTKNHPNNYIDINGKIFRYFEISKNPDRIAALIDTENIREAIEALP